MWWNIYFYYFVHALALMLPFIGEIRNRYIILLFGQVKEAITGNDNGTCAILRDHSRYFVHLNFERLQRLLLPSWQDYFIKLK
jgi:hypothetical protein